MTSAMPGRDARHAVVLGADLLYGASVATRLRTDGIRVVADIAALAGGIALDALVLDLSMAAADVSFRSVTEADFRASLDGQLYAFVAAVQAAVPRMTDGGAIVILLPKAFLGAWGGVHGAASAAACVAMARSMAIELAPSGIRVNAVATGGPTDDAQTLAEVAAVVVWLAGNDSAQVTGETILADRGASLQMAQAARR